LPGLGLANLINAPQATGHQQNRQPQSVPSRCHYPPYATRRPSPESAGLAAHIDREPGFRRPLERGSGVFTPGYTACQAASKGKRRVMTVSAGLDEPGGWADQNRERQRAVRLAVGAGPLAGARGSV
jgi:hypothetical protein